MMPIFRRRPAVLISGFAEARRRLRRGLGTLLVVLSAMLVLLLLSTYNRLAAQAFLQQRFYAEQSALAINTELARVIDEEEQRPFDQYSFYNVGDEGVFQRNTLQLSPLAAPVPQTPLAGVVGFFQIAPDGSLSSPLLPPLVDGTGSTPLSASEVENRRRTLDRVAEVLRWSSTSAADPAPKKAPHAEGVSPPAAVNEKRKDSLTLSQDLFFGKKVQKSAEDPALLNQYRQQQPAADIVQKSAPKFETKAGIPRREKVQIITQDTDRSSGAAQNDRVGSQPSSGTLRLNENETGRISSFEGILDRFQLLDPRDGTHLVLFRKVWNGDRRFIQGVVIERGPFFQTLMDDKLESSALPDSAVVLVGSGAEPVAGFVFSRVSETYSQYGARSVIDIAEPSVPPDQVLLYRGPLPVPFEDYFVYFSVADVPLPLGGKMILGLGVLLGVALAAGLWLVYRLGLEQINLAEQRSNFVSAVSHELKTPLTSIRMYGEMLLKGWVKDEERRQSYYEYIFHESERLSRLIANVLRFSKLTTAPEKLELRRAIPRELLPLLVDKARILTAREEWPLTALLDAECEGGQVAVDVNDDALLQIAINLVDNAVKFSAESERKEVQLGFRHETSTDRVLFFVRDFGPGVPQSEQKKIFELFYRSESELTRKTRGTGIGLALVAALARQMEAAVEYRPSAAGAEFVVAFHARRNAAGQPND